MVLLEGRIKTQSNQLFDAWYLKVVALPRLTKRMYQAGVKKVLFCSRLL